ncbi:dolichyl pyrophosphate Man9GlcNAc2 alpha-1,3-glucosyltransferase-like [Salvelinus sp. IW2-2015]|uniref:dolichyl pyrophosphate Man9GlcNAc2 alpha-1,3-glucosyltransferase-like n=1 Tax=Salvelinus sp. IW2-2015 TaxID=2691554 RepID=UPI000CDFF1AD|nr:dolichyl pyrophosphate Man9GlcNAc2 alpha-1,3-glucosyltransferase-like [Salvelinus alpinus]
MLPLLLKDGLLVPYVVTSLAFLFVSVYLLFRLEHCSEDELRLGPYHRPIRMPSMDLGKGHQVESNLRDVSPPHD